MAMEMDNRTMHERRTQKVELQVLSPSGLWQRLGYFRTENAARKAAGYTKGTTYRIYGDEEVKAIWQVE